VRIFSIPASYRRAIEAHVALGVADVGRDVARRADDDERIRKWWTIPESMIDDRATGRVVIVVMDEALAEELGAQLDPGAVRVA
jgi:hypothetical protein